MCWADCWAEYSFSLFFRQFNDYFLFGNLVFYSFAGSRGLSISDREIYKQLATPVNCSVGPYAENLTANEHYYAVTNSMRRQSASGNMMLFVVDGEVLPSENAQSIRTLQLRFNLNFNLFLHRLVYSFL